jgi:hypothetical protein
VANLATPEPVVRALLTEADRRRQGRGVAILRAMVALHPQKTWRMSALWPEELAGVFLAAGFSREPLSQWQMLRPLD